MKASIMILLGLIIVVGPWTARNYKVFNKFVPVSTLGGESFLANNNERISQDGIYRGVRNLKGVEELQGLGEVEKDKAYWRLSLNYLKTNPSKIPLLISMHLKNLFDPIPHPKVKGRLIVMLSYGVLLPFMFLGLVLSLKEFKRFLLIYLILFLHIITAAVFGGYSRYRQPMEPFLIMFAAYSILFIVSFIRKMTFARIKNE